MSENRYSRGTYFCVVSKKKRKRKSSALAIILWKEISIRNLTFANHAVTISTVSKCAAIQRPFISENVGNTDLLSTSANACCSKRHSDDKGKVSRWGTSLSRAIVHCFAVKHGRYCSLIFWSAVILANLIFDASWMWKNIHGCPSLYYYEQS